MDSEEVPVYVADDNLAPLTSRPRETARRLNLNSGQWLSSLRGANGISSGPIGYGRKPQEIDDALSARKRATHAMVEEDTPEGKREEEGRRY